MSQLKLLLPGAAVVGDLDEDRVDALHALADLYAYPDPVPPGGWVRANMVTTLDGSASGADGLSGTIGGAADKVVFSALRGLADVVLVGAGTARAEGYHRPVPKPDFAERRMDAGQWPAPVLAIVTRSGDLPKAPKDEPDRPLFGGPDGAFVVTCADADLDAIRAVAGVDRVIVAGEDDVDPVIAVAQLAARGMRRVLLEGGPRLLGQTIATGRLDELCMTVSPLLVGGEGPRISHGDAASLRLRVAHLVACDDVLLGRWLVAR